MRFRFCGDLDAPEWLLREISVLSRMSSIRMLLVCRQVIESLLGRNINYEKITKLTTGRRLHFETGDIKAMVAALHFILRSSAKYDVDDGVLLSELQQLGLPRDVSTAICRCFKAGKQRLRRYLESQTLHLARLEQCEWRVDFILASSMSVHAKQPTVRFNMALNVPHETRSVNKTTNELVTDSLTDANRSRILTSFEMTADKFRVFFNELKAAKSLMDSI